MNRYEQAIQYLSQFYKRTINRKDKTPSSYYAMSY